MKTDERRNPEPRDESDIQKQTIMEQAEERFSEWESFMLRMTQQRNDGWR